MVYDIQVEDYHEYFANNILVHNCSDTFDYLVCMAFANDYLTYQKGTDAIIATVGKNKHSKHGY